MRCLAIVLVVLTHGLPLWPGVPAPASTVLSALPDGVEVFFALSGFLIGHILLRTSLHGGGLLRFWTRRWLRTLPAYFAVLAISLGLAHSGHLPDTGTTPWWRFATFTHNLTTPFSGFFWESWSLSIEEWFYLLAPLLMLATSRLGMKRAYLLSAFALILLAGAWRWQLDPGMTDAYGWDQWYRKLVPGRLDAIGWGLVAAWAQDRWPTQFRTHRHAAFALGVALVTALFQLDSDWNGGFMRVGFLGVQSIGVALLLPAFASWHRPMPGFGIVHFLSRISYSLYLVNLGWVAGPLRRHLDEVHLEGGPEWFALYLMLAIGLATGLYLTVERPFMRWRDRLTGPH